MIYTPVQFLDSFISLLRQHHRASTVVLKGRPPSTLGTPHFVGDGHYGAAPQDDDVLALPTAGAMDIQVQFCLTRRGGDAGAGLTLSLAGAAFDEDDAITGGAALGAPSDQAMGIKRDGLLVLASCRVLGSRVTITPRWCAQLQRVMSCAALLSSSSGEGRPRGENATARHFIVDIPHLVPFMSWNAQQDGYFSSQQHATVERVVSLPFSEAGADDNEKEDERHGNQRVGVEARLAVAAVLNAGIPIQCFPVLSPDGRRPLGVMVLHAPDYELLTGDSPQEEGRAHLFHFLKDFTTKHVIPRVELASVGAEWVQRECGTTQECSTVAEIGSTHLAAYPPGREGSRITNIVFLLHCPTSVWRRVHAEEKKGCVPEPYQEGGVPSSLTASPTAASLAWHLADLVNAVLRRVAAENVDLFCFPRGVPKAVKQAGNQRDDKVEDGGGEEEATKGMKASSPHRVRREEYSDDVLCYSIAESITKIIFLSSNASFVREAQQILFGRHPSEVKKEGTTHGGDNGENAALSRCSFEVIRDAIDARLRDQTRGAVLKRKKENTQSAAKKKGERGMTGLESAK